MYFVLYVLALFFPPLVLLATGRPFQAFFNVFLCMILWVPGVIHALAAISSYKKDKQIEALIDGMSNQSR